jgi:1-deoxy-D-xylulose-5-phosphate synthase
MSWEAINNIAVDKDLPLVIVVNDNERSYAPTIGGLADHLATLRTTRKYESVLGWGKDALNRTPVVGGVVYGALHGMKKGIKDIVAPQGMFEDLGLKYLGPIDGHDDRRSSRRCGGPRRSVGPCSCTVLTQKGNGYHHARNDDADRFHAVDRINPGDRAAAQVKGRIWTDEFSDALLPSRASGTTSWRSPAAMLIPTGLKEFADRHPTGSSTSGSPSSTAVTMASGLAFGGLHRSYVCYATFLNRAFDQLLMDCAAASRRRDASCWTGRGSRH